MSISSKYKMFMFVVGVLMCIILYKKPYRRRQESIWRIECELGVITDVDCPVDGGWAPWGPWSPCSGPCDDVGHRKRTRECINPTPSNDGMPCSGPSEQIESCYLRNCTVEDYQKLIVGDPARIEAMHQLETVPALMERCLQMECPFEAIEAALSTDNTWQLSAENLWNSLQCVKHNLGCPVVGEWGAWGSWSTCGARCGHGLRWRLRRCDTPPPSDAHLMCEGSPLHAEDCEGDQCAIDEENTFLEVSGTWSEWGEWSSCSEKCGSGVRRRRRICYEKYTTPASGIWGTHCRGQHDELEVCENRECILDGGWSGWGAWGPCSQSCDAGRRSRVRSCTRPMPVSNGSPCIGPRVEIGSCHLTPCEAYSHTVAVLNGESYIQYDLENKHSMLFHFYIRFMPLSPHGILVRRGELHNPLVRLTLQRWHVCLDANGLSRSCRLPRLCTHSIIEPAVWHSVLITITSETATLRLDDAHLTVRNSFPCDPELPDEKMNIVIGEKMRGEIQEVILNFIPLHMMVQRGLKSGSSFVPSFVSNVAYETASIEEAYLTLDDDQYLRLPCFNDQDEWRLELTIKPIKESATIVFLRDQRSDNWLHVLLQNLRIKLKLAIGDYRSESSSSTDCPPNQWLDVTLQKKRETNTIETCINSRERLHVVFGEDITRKRRDSRKSKCTDHHKMRSNANTSEVYCNEQSMPEHSPKSGSFVICTDEFFIGGIPTEMKKNINEESMPFSGVIASVSINRVLQDLHDFSLERHNNGQVQVSSKTASVSGLYHETAWGKSNRLNLTCLHARTIRSPRPAHWLFLDTSINGIIKDKSVRSLDDGRVLRLVASADNGLRGFYTCRAHANKRTRNIVTYGVTGKVQYKLSGPDTTTAIAVVTTLALVIGTLTWLVIEGIHDLRNGYGFFRDAHLSPEEEAEAVCKYIDQNIHLIGSKSAAKIAKARARNKGKQLASRSSFAAQEPQGLMQVENCVPRNSDESTISEPAEGLPALPEIKSCVEPSASHDVYRCEPSYVSSPRHGSNITSPRAKLTSSSSLELTSPRVLCSRLLLAKRIHSSKESFAFKKRSTNTLCHGIPPKIRSKLLTIKSSTYINQSPVYKVLQAFQKLKMDDS